MALDSKNLGRLRRVTDPRSVWLSEAGDFTPWLAENIDVLADELGMTLTVVTTEVAVGEFWLDIRAEDENGRIVVIENQLGRTDHGHLGQSLVYAAGLDAAAVVWVATRFREDHRSALDWLNERTDSTVGFFGVEVSVVQIDDDGPQAPVFTVVSRPNDWQKSVKSAGGADAEAVNPLNAVRQDFLTDVLTRVHARRPAFRVPARSRHNWSSFAFGPFGNWGLAIAGGTLRVEAYLDLKDRDLTKDLFDTFAADRAHWETRSGVGPLSWERLDDKRACRIAIYHPVDLDDDRQRDAVRDWAVTTVLALFDALDEPLRRAADTVRVAAAAAAAADSDAPDGSTRSADAETTRP
ncbi:MULTISPECIES: DUF4268 domain-containing protein [Rhodococcus]|uniref:DUF4268 domain-containing protein n=1 Tax=Rhodococcus TaxID=1827 RepID=UPI00193B6478|nr:MULTISPECIES: DUF4268 domain-containing protein [Rhodococcus]QRI75046.1 DUF4268 domain-containing protein [Rhodococcus aetherivorans]QSE58455.1 DUF4268 domain-containing protein [Rhodococcus sp. PSBB066]QSE70222.1 DUF4268 domain-containing protein [Rhodococcus sp. PSBB049]